MILLKKIGTPLINKKFGKIDKHQHSSEESSSLTSPGQLDSHYAPNTPLKILNSPEEFDCDPSKNSRKISKVSYFSLLSPEMI